MTERPILFSGPMVRAILDGRKAVTRRVVTVPWKGPRRAFPYAPYWVDDDGRLLFCDEYGDYHPVESCLSRWSVGDRLWVRETFALSIRDPDSVVERDARDPSHWDGPVYREGYDGGEWTHYEDGARTMVSPPWRPSIHMPRWASRITLEVTSVRVERLHAIDEQDAIREGVEDAGNARHAFRTLWDKINGKRASWATNPWVWRIEFRRVTP